jgi:plastocyanin
MKIVISLIALVIILGLGWYFNQVAEAPESVIEHNTESTSDTMETTDHGAESTDTSHGEVDAMEASENTAEPQVPTNPSGPAQTFTLDSFSFGYSQTEIRVKEGTTVTINLTNSGGFHDWVLDEFSAATKKIKEGETASVTFVADKAGTYEYYCSIGSHRANGMVGKLIVE